jgi:hypothetical protein
MSVELPPYNVHDYEMARRDAMELLVEMTVLQAAAYLEPHEIDRVVRDTLAGQTSVQFKGQAVDALQRTA